MKGFVLTLGEKKSFFKTVLTVLLIFLAVWLFTLIKNDILTLVHYDDFADGYKSNTMLQGEMEYFKVLSCSDKKADVYYVSEGFTEGNVLTFEKKDGVWVYREWKDTVWTRSGGNATGVVWPYFWHFIYGGF